MKKRLLLPLLAVTLVLYTAVCGPAADPANTGVVVDRARRLVIIDAKIAPRKIDDPRYTQIYPIEVVACYPFPRGQKAHETVVTIEAKPSEVHRGLEALGIKPGAPVVGEAKDPPMGPELKIFLEFAGPDGETKRVPIERTMVDIQTGKPLKSGTLKWRFTGSAVVKPDPNKDETVYAADRSGTLIAIFPVTNETVFQTNLTMKEEKFVKLETDKKLLPKEGTAVKLILEVPEAK
jgi:hypothetical protein